ncbi:serine hydrolase [uncultured Victivallis sp.]|uniref:serine hydrolase domain-containing protein n=1 Tax=uncultured Victivallis sp. TaxID=354118 RepID=UPI0025DCE2DA|nr:serine hydrolase domain-containing protein [uncultured Victivallis sp.]
MQILPRSMPEAEGISSTALRKFAEALRGLDSVHSVMVMRHGRVVAEGWKKPYGPETPHMLFSLSKSFTSCAVGFACAEGKLSLDARLVDLFRDKLPECYDPKFETMRIRHLLSMTSGHDHCTMADMQHAPDWERAFFRTTPVYEPGTHFCYNSGASYMLSAAVVRATKESLCDYLRPRLFEPLGIAPRLWELSPQGIETGGWGFNLTTEEIASFAQCLLDGGRRDGRQVIPAEYLAQATSIQSDNSMNDQPDWKVGYGFQFWRCRHNAFRGDGAFGQYAIAMPEQGIAIAITSGLRNMQQILDLVWDFVLPAAQNSALPPAAEEESALRQELAAWAMPVFTSAGAELPRRIYHLEANDLQFKELSFASLGDHVELSLDGETLRAGFGFQADNLLTWREAQPRRVAASVRRISDREFELLACCYETPFQWHIQLEFGDDAVTLVRRANVCFRTADWPVLRGRRS